ncbi:MAG: hypothetical protein NC342_06725 [Pseudoflavonifractor sp.]|nr:hypothetical protein [Alloprevotella sp.]MCM1117211.1 hypothetical protein [Pseudoflavonifractor sp.]
MHTPSFIIASLTALAAASPISASAQSQSPDTIAVFNQANEVTITNSPAGNTVTIVEKNAIGVETRHTFTVSDGLSNPFINSPKGWNITRLFQSRQKVKSPARPHSRVDGARGIYAGGLIPIGSHGPVTGGWEIGVKNLIMGEWIAGRGLPSLSIGAGFGWKFQTVGHGFALYSQEGALCIMPRPDGVNDLSSRIKSFHLTIPITLTIPLHGKFAAALSGELHLNTYTTASTSWSMTDPTSRATERTKINYKGLHQKIATLELSAAIGWTDALGAYISWAPFNPFKKGYGPEYKTLAVGATINF